MFCGLPRTFENDHFLVQNLKLVCNCRLAHKPAKIFKMCPELFLYCCCLRAMNTNMDKHILNELPAEDLGASVVERSDSDSRSFMSEFQRSGSFSVISEQARKVR